MSATDDAIQHLRRLADLPRPEGRRKLKDWATKVLESPAALDILERLAECGAQTVDLLEIVERWHVAPALFDGEIKEVGIEFDALPELRHTDGVLTGDAPRKESDPPDKLLRRIRRPNAESYRLRDPDYDVELEFVRGAIVSRARVVDHEPAPKAQGAGHPTEWARAVLAVMVATHVRRVAPDKPLSLALGFLVRVARYRDLQVEGDPSRAERERLRRNLKNDRVLRRVAYLSEVFDLPVSLD